MSTTQTLDVGKLKIRTEYQRNLDEGRVSRMAKSFDPQLAGALEVAEDGPDYWVIDGQHRLAAMRKAKVNKCLAIVHRGLSLEQEADLFARLNTDRRAITPIALFKAELTAGRPRAMEMAGILMTYELSVGHHSRRSIQSVGVLYGLHRSGVLESTLQIISEAWFDGDGMPAEMALDGRVLNAVGRFLNERQNDDRFDLSHFRRVLMRMRPDWLIREAQDYSSFAVGARMALTRWYNHKLQSQNRLAE